MSGDGGSRGHLRADEVSAAALSLAALEVTIGARRAAFSWLKYVRVHPEAHRAAGLAPLEASFGEDPIEALLFRLELHLRRTGDDEREDPVRYPPAFGNGGGSSEIFDARVSA